MSTESTISQDVNQTTRNNSITAFNKTPSQTTPAFTCIFSINEKLTVNKKKRLENQVFNYGTNLTKVTNTTIFFLGGAKTIKRYIKIQQKGANNHLYRGLAQFGS